MAKILPVEDVICTECRGAVEAAPKLDSLGLRRFQCSHCGASFRYPMAEGRRRMYVAASVLFTVASAGLFLKAGIPPVGLVLPIGVAAGLVQDRKVRAKTKSVLAGSNEHETPVEPSPELPAKHEHTAHAEPELVAAHAMNGAVMQASVAVAPTDSSSHAPSFVEPVGTFEEGPDTFMAPDLPETSDAPAVHASVDTAQRAPAPAVDEDDDPPFEMPSVPAGLTSVDPDPLVVRSRWSFSPPAQVPSHDEHPATPASENEQQAPQASAPVAAPVEDRVETPVRDEGAKQVAEPAEPTESARPASAPDRTEPRDENPFLAAAPFSPDDYEPLFAPKPPTTPTTPDEQAPSPEQEGVRETNSEPEPATAEAVPSFLDEPLEDAVSDVEAPKKRSWWKLESRADTKERKELKAAAKAAEKATTKAGRKERKRKGRDEADEQQASVFVQTEAETALAAEAPHVAQPAAASTEAPELVENDAKPSRRERRDARKEQKHAEKLQAEEQKTAEKAEKADARGDKKQRRSQKRRGELTPIAISGPAANSVAKSWVLTAPKRKSFRR